MGDLSERPCAPRLVWCPFCGAKPGEPCVLLSTGDRAEMTARHGGHHIDRINAALRVSNAGKDGNG